MTQHRDQVFVCPIDTFYNFIGTFFIFFPVLCTLYFVSINIRHSRDVEIGHVKVEAPPSYDQMGQSNNTDGIDVDGDDDIYIPAIGAFIIRSPSGYFCQYFIR